MTTYPPPLVNIVSERPLIWNNSLKTFLHFTTDRPPFMSSLRPCWSRLISISIIRPSWKFHKSVVKKILQDVPFLKRKLILHSYHCIADSAVICICLIAPYDLWTKFSWEYYKMVMIFFLFFSILSFWKTILRICIQPMMLLNAIYVIIATVQIGVWNNTLIIIMEIEMEELENVISVEM